MWVMLLKPKESADVERSIQLNPNNDAYWQARGYDKRPANWKQLAAQSKSKGSVKTAPNPNSQTRKKRKKKGREYTPHGTELRGRVGPLEWDDFGLLPSDGFGRLSADDY